MSEEHVQGDDVIHRNRQVNADVNDEWINDQLVGIDLQTRAIAAQPEEAVRIYHEAQIHWAAVSIRCTRRLLGYYRRFDPRRAWYRLILWREERRLARLEREQ